MMRTYQNTPLDRITRERDIAFDVARAFIWRARELGVPHASGEMRNAVWIARGLQWNAAHVYRMRLATEVAA